METTLNELVIDTMAREIVQATGPVASNPRHPGSWTLWAQHAFLEEYNRRTGAEVSLVWGKSLFRAIINRVADIYEDPVA